LWQLKVVGRSNVAPNILQILLLKSRNTLISSYILYFLETTNHQQPSSVCYFSGEILTATTD